MAKQPKEQIIWGCSNPSVNDGSMMCDGVCEFCQYHYVAEKKKIYK